MQGTRRGLERFGGPVKTGRAGSWGGGACGPGGPPALSTPSGGISGRRGQGKVSCQAAPAPRCPVHYQGQPRRLRCRARRLQPAEEPSQSQRSRLRARPPPSARGPRSQRWDRWNRAAPGRAGSERAGERWPRPEKGRSAAAETEPLPGSSGYLSARPGCAQGGEGRGLGGLGHPHPAGSGREGAAAHPPSPPAG